MAVTTGDQELDRLLARRAGSTKTNTTRTTAPTVSGSLSGASKTLGAVSNFLGGAFGPVGSILGQASQATGLLSTATKAPLTGGGGGVTAPTRVAAPQQAPIAPTVQPPVVQPPTTTAEETGGGAPNDSLQRFTEQDIAAALAAIEAEFGLTREELLRDQTMIGAQYRLLTAQLARQRSRALEGAEAGALQRGLFRSGIFASEVGEIGQQFAEVEAEQSAAKQAQQAELQAQIEALEAQKEAAKAAEESAIRRGEYTARLRAAGL